MLLEASNSFLEHVGSILVLLQLQLALLRVHADFWQDRVLRCLQLLEVLLEVAECLVDEALSRLFTRLVLQALKQFHCDILLQLCALAIEMLLLVELRWCLHRDLPRFFDLLGFGLDLRLGLRFHVAAGELSSGALATMCRLKCK